ncbi:MAG: TIGR04282 family arsenosugar biosynthesis glycosyltransferase [Bacteroidota bacterium]|nr:TIGR04282 family arsenosugar biosynthesis glycosyltransferase [Bacteroidota bacterium]
MKRALIIFIKNPAEGEVKTRLAATVGNHAALCIYNKLVTHTKTIASGVSADKYLFYSSHIDVNDEWNRAVFAKELQTGNHLGEKMRNAFDSLFNKGYKQVAIIGSDCPDLTTDLVEQAFKELVHSDIVIGPATDGGYYLLALKKLFPEIFENIAWSTNEVLKQTLTICNRINTTFHLLPVLSDVDVAEDIIGREEFFSSKK